MISSLLIANRGEIARRIIRTCRRLGVETVAVYSEADRDMPFVAEADQAIAIGPAAARDSYLVAEKILNAARQSGAEAIHPGYGFLSENPDFAEAVIAAGLVWVGPPPSAIRAMGLKDAAKALMQQAGVPVTPGYLGEDQSEQRLTEEAKRLGYPVMIKAVAGGGGKGMRRVEQAEDFVAALASCRREAASAFGDDRVLLETYVSRPRHIEVQIFADRHGNVVHLFERDCSLQRRHQKVIEEAPAPGMTPETREAVCAAAIQAARAVAYEGAGTVEFIADASAGLRADRIWFMEMNTRLQVEHPVTEAITGQDLVEWQLRVASGEPLPLAQSELTINGHAIEARLYAEDPRTGFLPSIGAVDHLSLPTDLVRVDSAIEQGDAVTPYYDPMIAKLIAHGPSRADAVTDLAVACDTVEIWPIKTNAGFLSRVLDHPDFLAASLDTGFIGQRLEALVPPLEPSEAVLSTAAHMALAQTGIPAALRGFRLNAETDTTVYLDYDGAHRAIRALPIADDVDHTALIGDDEIIVFEAGEAYAFSTPRPETGSQAASEDSGILLSPMPGLIVAVFVEIGQKVVKGTPLIVLEAMKMEYTLAAPFAGKVTMLSVRQGDRVPEQKPLATLEAEAE